MMSNPKDKKPLKSDTSFDSYDDLSFIEKRKKNIEELYQSAGFMGWLIGGLIGLAISLLFEFPVYGTLITFWIFTTLGREIHRHIIGYLPEED